MSDSLDDKLREILQTLAVANISREHPTLVGDFMIEIKQAFSEAKWRYPTEFNKDFDRRWNLMTGQEWYDRFVGYLHDVGICLDTTRYKDLPQVKLLFEASVLAAAKRASGIE